MGNWTGSRRVRIILALVGVALLLVSLVLLGYALPPGVTPVRLQATLAPILQVLP